MRRLALWLLLLSGLAVAALVAANAWVIGSTRVFVFEDLERIPTNDVGLVLGTSPYTRHGSRNLLFRHRIQAAASLYRAGKVRHLLLSGANPDETYNEPRKMYQALRAAGVPDAAMTMDFAGFRTLDSMIRAREIFGLDRLTIISQRFHDYRAVFIARHEGLDAVAYHSPQEDASQSLRVEAREFLARARAVLDLFVIFTQPRFLGEARRIELPADAADDTTSGEMEAGRKPADNATDTPKSDSSFKDKG